MKGLLAFVLIGALTGCQDKDETSRYQHPAAYLMAHLEYVKDDRTGLCFAYGLVGEDNGGPVLATVSCDAAKKYLPKTSPEDSL